MPPVTDDDFSVLVSLDNVVRSSKFVEISLFLILAAV